MYWWENEFAGVKENRLALGGVDAAELAKAHGTPIYVYGKRRIRARFEELRDLAEGLTPLETRICYAMKANPNAGILRTLRTAGSWIDAVSPKEVRAAMAAGFPAGRILFTGTSVSADDLRQAFAIPGLTVNIDAAEALELMREVRDAGFRGRKIRVSVRWNPGIGRGFNPKAVTAGERSTDGTPIKFGVEERKVVDVFLRARKLGFTPVGLHQHLGSGWVREDYPTVRRAVDRMVRKASELRALGFRLEFLDFGGGFGPRYFKSQSLFPVADYFRYVCGKVGKAGLDVKALAFEPGKYLVGDAGALLLGRELHQGELRQSLRLRRRRDLQYGAAPGDLHEGEPRDRQLPGDRRAEKAPDHRGRPPLRDRRRLRQGQAVAPAEEGRAPGRPVRRRLLPEHGLELQPEGHPQGGPGLSIRVIDLRQEDVEPYCLCLEDWSPEIREAGGHKRAWYERMKDRGLRVKLALDDAGTIGGMIQYVPIELSFVEGRDLYFVNCVWVHGHKQGRGDFRKKGMGKALLEAAEDDARARGAAGMAAWGMALPVFMRASWFRKHGYRKADGIGMQVLLWKPFRNDAAAPKWIREKKRPEPGEGKVNVTAFLNGWCPAMNMTFERAKRAAAEFGDRVDFRAVDTFDRETFLEWGVSDALFVDGKPVRTGPPPSYEKIRKRIARRVKRAGA